MTIFEVIHQYREGIERSETSMLRDLARQWASSYRYLKKQVDALMTVIQAQQDRGEPVWIGYVHSLERYRNMMEQTRRTIDKYNRAALGRISGEEADAVEIGRETSRKLVNIAEPDDPMWTRVNTREGRIAAGMLSESSPLRSLLDKSWPETSNKLNEVLTVGLTTGQGTNWIAQRMMEAVKIPEKRALVIARTEVNRAYREAHLETMRESRAVIGYRRMCYPPTACFACLEMDGEFYEKSQSFSDHPNGKCSAVPVTKHFDPINDPKWERGQQWFERQSEETQRKIMGPGRFDLWKKDGVNPRDMVYIKENPLWGGSPTVKTLEELKDDLFTNVSFRLGVPVQPTEMTLEMALSREYRVQTIVNKYHINLSAGGKNVTIKIDGSLRGKAGKVAKDDPTTIILSDSAFISEEELACTIAHELVHCREYVNIGKSDEIRSYESEGKLREFIRGQR